MSINIETLIRPNIATLKAYTPILPFEVLSEQLQRSPDDIIKLDANENPYGPAPKVAEVLAESRYMHIYPDPESRILRTSLADYTGVEADSLLVGHGADELIDLLLRLFIDPGDRILNCPPTFGMYAFDGAVSGATVIDVPRRPDFSLDMAGIEAEFLIGNVPKLLFVASPNNPDGSVLTDVEVKHLLALPTIVVLDEAYIEFSGNSRIDWVQQHDNLVVLRTFSKWAGLAGLRVGYGAFPQTILTHLWKIKQPYNVNVAGQIAANSSLEERAWLLEKVDRLIAERTRFYELAKEIPWLKPYPSQTNFILCQVLDRDASSVKEQLAAAGILIRYYNSPGLSDHIRISIGTPTQMNRLVEVLKQL